MLTLQDFATISSGSISGLMTRSGVHRIRQTHLRLFCWSVKQQLSFSSLLSILVALDSICKGMSSLFIHTREFIKCTFHQSRMFALQCDISVSKAVFSTMYKEDHLSACVVARLPSYVSLLFTLHPNSDCLQLSRILSNAGQCINR